MNPYYYQKQAIDSFFTYVKAFGRRGVIVIPTGGGKSLVQAKIVNQVYEEGGRILCLTHDENLVNQNYEEMLGIMPILDAGTYAAGLKKRDTDNRVIFAMINSVHKKALHLGRFDLIIVDEAHLINNKSQGMYRKFIEKQFEMNPNLVLLGLTATPYRLKGGYLTYGPEAIFDDIIHETPIEELMDKDHPNNLDKTQYLSKLISKKSVTKVDLSDVKLVAGEYNQGQMEDAFDKITRKSVQEILEYTHDRKKVIIFCSGIKHAEHVARLIPGSKTVHSKKSGNKEIIEEFRRGEFKYLINVDKLTTGFNVKDVDCLAILRATKSPGLWVQIVGRGTRMFPGKEDCLVLDFGGNIEYHGPIDKITVKNPQEKKSEDFEDLGAPIKECPECHELLAIQLRFCKFCGYVFPENPGHGHTASDMSVISEKLPPETIKITGVEYYRHSKEGKPDSMRVDYLKGLGYVAVSEWVALDHGGFATKKAIEWIEKRTDKKPADVDELLEISSELEKPVELVIDFNGKFPAIIEHVFDKMAGVPF